MGEELEKIHQEDEATVGTFLNDPKVKENYQGIAKQLKSLFGEGWFTVDMIHKKSQVKDYKVIKEMLTGLQLFKLARSKEGGKLYKNQLKFQLTLTPEMRLKVLQEEKQNTEQQLELINKEIEKVEVEIEESSNR